MIVSLFLTSTPALPFPAGTYNLVHSALEIVDTTPGGMISGGAAGFVTAMVGMWSHDISRATRLGRAAAIGGVLMLAKGITEGVQRH